MLNNVVLMGRLTADPELRHTPNGIAVTSFTLAVGRSYSKAGSERATDFIDIVAWRNTAEFVSRYFTKGQLVAVEGSIQTRTYQDKDGNNRKAFEIVASNVHFAEAKREQNGSYNNYDKGPSATYYQQSENTMSSFDNGNVDDFREIPTDDDLPF